jgi:hypothetical protein
MVANFLLSSIPGVTVVSQRSGGGGGCTEFSVAQGAEEQVIHSLLRLLDSGGELWINDWEQDDGESAIAARRVGSRFETMSGGHGYSSSWTPTDVEHLTTTFLRLLRFSHAGPYKVHGSFESGGLGLVGGSGFEGYR